MSDKSPTPDMLPRFQGGSRLDKAPHGVIGRDNAPQIKENKQGPHCHLDSPQGGGRGSEASLGAGGASLSGAASSIKSGARAPKVDRSALAAAGRKKH